MNNPYTAKFQITGTVVSIGETRTFPSGFQKRDLVVNTGANVNYPSPVLVSLTKDYCAKADSLGVGDEVSVEGFVNGRKWDGPNGVRYFTDLVAKAILVTKKAGAPAAEPDYEDRATPEDEMPF